MLLLLHQLVAALFLFHTVATQSAPLHPAPAWWRFGEFLNEQLEEYGVLPTIPCNQFDLTPRQSEICEDPRNRDLMISLGTSVNLAVQVCNTTFENRQWRCHYTGDDYVFGKIIGAQGKESAALYSVVAAMAMYTVTRDCAYGQISTLCGCAPRPAPLTNDKWAEAAPKFYTRESNVQMSWAGCTEDITTGYRLTKEFVDSSWLPLPVSPYPTLPPWHPTLPPRFPPILPCVADNLVKLHNSEHGRRLVNKSLVIKCRCHGMSGSCNTQTCWKEMKHWDEVGQDIKEDYDAAVKVKLNNHGTKLINSDATVKKHVKDDLVYLRDSPSFCEKDVALGVEGTHGRQCNISHLAEDSCGVLCCSHGHKTIQRDVIEPCKPKLIRYPQIKIVYQRCKKTLTEYFCK